MKILHIMPYSPVPQNFGGAIRVFQLLKSMSRHHEVTVFSYGSPEDYENLRQSFYPRVKEIHMLPPPRIGKYRRLVQFWSLWTKRSFIWIVEYSKDTQMALDRLLERNEFDIVQTEFTTICCF